MENSAKGKLYIVATPIGNLEDVTYRAIKILGQVVFILAEDTRRTKILLDHYKIATKLVSYRDQNHYKMMEKVFEKLDQGIDLALVTDSGTPLISDPGFRLVEEVARSQQYQIVPIPGASAVIAALSVAGIPTDRFLFLGFLPKAHGQRIALLTKYVDIEATLVIYESPNRLDQLFKQINEVFGERVCVTCKDLTKLHEKVTRAKTSEHIEMLKNSLTAPRGEYVVLVAKKG